MALTAEEPPALTFKLDTGGREFVPRDSELRIVASRPLTNADGRFALFVGTTDVTGMWVKTETGFVRQKRALRLPIGESTLTIYQIASESDWREVATITIKVLTTSGFE